jgi:hypothetical protein
MLAGEERLAGMEPLVLRRTRLDFLILHSMMLREESGQSAELSDLCVVHLLSEEDNGLSCRGDAHHYEQDNCSERQR